MTDDQRLVATERLFDGHGLLASPPHAHRQKSGASRVARARVATPAPDAATSTDYAVAMAKRTPIPVRFEESVAARLAVFAGAHPGLSLSSAVNLLVDEGLRMHEHPEVTFRNGPTGRRASLVGGPDVWEIIRAVRSARGAEPELAEDALLTLVGDNTGLSTRQVRTALRYWAAYPVEVDAEIAAADDAELAAERAWRREQGLLSGQLARPTTTPTMNEILDRIEARGEGRVGLQQAVEDLEAERR